MAGGDEQGASVGQWVGQGWKGVVFGWRRERANGDRSSCGGDEV